MKHSTRRFSKCSYEPLVFCLICLVALLGVGVPVASSRSAQKLHRVDPGETYRTAKVQNSVCVANSIDGTEATYTRPTTGSTEGACLISAQTVHYDVFNFSLTGCGTFPTAVTISTCGPAGCAAADASFDSVIAVYRQGGSTGAGGGASPFSAASPCTNFVDINGDSPSCPNGSGGFPVLSELTVSLASGFFAVVVSSEFSTASAGRNITGSYNLSLDVPGAGCTVTAIKLVSFTAMDYDGRALLEWQTGYEVDNLGFNVYREEGGKRLLITPQLLAGSALMAGPGTAMTAGRSYSWWDDSGFGLRTSGSERAYRFGLVRYWLEELDLYGQSIWHGPVEVQSPGVGLQGSGPNARPAIPLSSVGRVGNETNQTVPVEPRTAAPQMATSVSSLRSSLGAGAAVKLLVKQEGWYRITGQELTAAGLDSGVDPRSLHLYAEGKEQPIAVVGEEDGRLDPADTVEFYGLGIDSPYTDTHVYWLVPGAQAGQRIPKVGGAAGASPQGGSFLYTVERRDRSDYFAGLRNGERENFFGAVVGKDPADQALTLQHLARGAPADAQLEVALQGVTLQPHRVRVYLNGGAVGNLAFQEQAQGVVKIPISQQGLREGVNQVRLAAEGGQGDVSLVDYIRISYWHSFTADGNLLRFTALGQRAVTLDGFTNGRIRVMDITRVAETEEVTSSVRAQSGSYGVTFTVPGVGERRLMAFTEEQTKHPGVSAYLPSAWSLPGAGYDYVVIGYRDFLKSVEPLKSLREGQGLSVAVVDVESLYNEFSFGDKTPHAIKDFLAATKANWKRVPRFVLFLGDASLDPKNYLKQGDFDYVPTKLIDTVRMETASDDWFTDFNGQGEQPQMAVGRLPVRTVQEAGRMISKILTYEQSTRADGVLLVADANDGFDFEGATQQLRGLIPAGVRVKEIDRGRVDPVVARNDLLDSINRGQRIVNYTGHGSVDFWRANLFTAADARELTNRERLPVFVMLTCLNGYFQDPGLESLAEALLKAEHGGAVAVWASSGLTEPDEQAVMNQQMFKLMYTSRGTSRIGEVVGKAKTVVIDGDIRRTWILFGDPAMRLK